MNGNDYLLTKLDTTLELHSVAGFHRLGTIDVKFKAPWYDSIVTSLQLGSGTRTDLSLDLKRDDTFRYFGGWVTDYETGLPVAGAVFSIDGGTFKDTTDAEGHFMIDIPEDRQREYKNVLISCEGYELFDSPEEYVADSTYYTLKRGK